MSAPPRIHLSPPHCLARDRELLIEAFDSNWIAPLGPHVDAFESEFAAEVGTRHAVAVSSGTAALHLALIVAGVQPGDRVLTPTLTFVATANAIRHAGATPVFVDSEPGSWNIDPVLVDQAAKHLADAGRPASAVVPVDLFGQCADYDALRDVCQEHSLRLIADAAESLGAKSRGRPAGSLAEISCFSFNGNKIITTSSGGMIATDNRAWADRARHLASQSRTPGVHYHHDEVGYNYRLSNLLAALGRSQLSQLSDRVAKRRAINRRYREALADLPQLSFMPEADYGEPTNWLTCLLVSPDQPAGLTERLRLALEADNIESRPMWKPLHLQEAHLGDVFCDESRTDGSVAEDVWQRGLCLPSGSSLTEQDQNRVVAALKEELSSRAKHAA